MSISEVVSALRRFNKGKAVDIHFFVQDGYDVARAYVKGVDYGYWSKKGLTKDQLAGKLLEYVKESIAKEAKK